MAAPIASVPDMYAMLQEALTNCAAVVDNIADGSLANADPERWAQAAAHLAGAIQSLRTSEGHVR